MERRIRQGHRQRNLRQLLGYRLVKVLSITRAHAIVAKQGPRASIAKKVAKRFIVVITQIDKEPLKFSGRLHMTKLTLRPSRGELNSVLKGRGVSAGKLEANVQEELFGLTPCSCKTSLCLAGIFSVQGALVGLACLRKERLDVLRDTAANVVGPGAGIFLRLCHKSHRVPAMCTHA